MQAGGEDAKVDRVEWLAITDPSTAMSALIAGEVDLIESLTPDVCPVLKADKNIELFGWNASGSQIVMHKIHLHPPFDNVKARQAALHAPAQEGIMRAQVGDPAIYTLCNAPFVCGTRFGKEYGDLLIKPDLETARALLKESSSRRHSGRDDAPDRPAVVEQRAARGQAAAREGRLEHLLHHQHHARFGQSRHHRLRRGTPRQGVVRLAVRSRNGEADPEKQKTQGHAISDRVIGQAVYAPVGQYEAFGAYRKDRLSGWLPGPVPVVWNISKK